MKNGLSMARIRTLTADNKGIALVEFALTMPFLLMLYLGAAQVCDTVAAQRKVTQTTRTVADIVSQYSSVSNGDLDEILAASSRVMSPYTGSPQIILSQVTMDGAGNPKVTWSRATSNTTALVLNSAYADLPASIRTPNSSVIVAKTTYEYAPEFGGFIVDSIKLGELVYMVPRTVVHITKV
jgi:Flp pilus assembly protein TadG